MKYPLKPLQPIAAGNGLIKKATARRIAKVFLPGKNHHADRREKIKQNRGAGPGLDWRRMVAPSGGMRLKAPNYSPALG
jgi:hypothetical protein